MDTIDWFQQKETADPFSYRIFFLLEFFVYNSNKKRTDGYLNEKYLVGKPS